MNKKQLIEAGINYDEGLERFCGNPEIYHKYLKRMVDDNMMQKLKEALDTKDYSTAFTYAHNLKGSSGNLSISSFYTVMNQLTDQLRSGEPKEDPSSLYHSAEILFDKVKKTITED